MATVHEPACLITPKKPLPTLGERFIGESLSDPFCRSAVFRYPIRLTLQNILAAFGHCITFEHLESRSFKHAPVILQYQGLGV